MFESSLKLCQTGGSKGMVQPSVGGSPAGKKAGQQRTISKRPPLSRCTTEGHPITKLRTPLFGDGIPSHMPPPLRRRRGNTQPCCNLMGMADIPTPRRYAQFITRTQLPVHRMPSAICSSRTTADDDRSQTFDSLPKACQMCSAPFWTLCATGKGGNEAATPALRAISHHSNKGG